MVIPYEQVLKEIEELSRKTPDGFTTQEMAEHTGHSCQWCRKQVKTLMAAGKMKMNGRRSVTRMDGCLAYVPVYSFY